MGKIFEISEAARKQARNFVENEKQFQLGILPTEKSEFRFDFPISDSPLEIWKHLAVKLALRKIMSDR